MRKNDKTRGLKKRLEALKESVEREPFAVISQDGVTFNDKAMALLVKNKINEEKLTCWLKSLVCSINSVVHCGLGVIPFGFPDKSGDMFVLLGESKAAGCDFDITKREKEVLECSIRHKTNRSIAKSLHISPGTVNSHFDSIYRKLGVSGRLEAVLLALRHGLIANPISMLIEGSKSINKP